MIPVLIILLAWWASAGAVASVKAARASSSAAATANAAAGTASDSSAAAPGDLTFGQWQRAAYSRWKRRIRSAIPGQHLGKKASDLIGDTVGPHPDQTRLAVAAADPTPDPDRHRTRTRPRTAGRRTTGSSMPKSSTTPPPARSLPQAGTAAPRTPKSSTRN
jgi:hypothetical protein